MSELERVKREYLLGNISAREAVNTLNDHHNYDRITARATVAVWAREDNNEVFSQ